MPSHMDHTPRSFNEIQSFFKKKRKEKENHNKKLYLLKENPQNPNFCRTDTNTCQKCLTQLLNPLKLNKRNPQEKGGASQLERFNQIEASTEVAGWDPQPFKIEDPKAGQ
jgi:hypothetical protein